MASPSSMIWTIANSEPCLPLIAAFEASLASYSPSTVNATLRFSALPASSSFPDTGRCAP